MIKDSLYYVQSSKVKEEPILRKVVTSKEDQQKIIRQCHVVNGVDGHFGVKKTLSAVQGRFYWKGIAADVNSFVKCCDPCQRENPQFMKVPATLHPIPVTASFWHQVGVDLVGPLQTSQHGNKYILTCCCYFTKWTEAIPLKDKSAFSVASALFKLLCEKGAASVFIHDQGTEFINGINSQLCRLMNITKWIATAYHPMTNGLDECWNGTLQTALRKVIDQDTQNDWDEHLDPIMAAYRASRHESTGFSPYFMVFHKEPCLPVDIEFLDNTELLAEQSSPVLHDRDSIVPYLHSMLGIKDKIRTLASENITKAQARQKKKFDKRHLIPTFQVGTKVLLNNMVRQARQGGKMESHFTGPYEIVEELGKGVYRLKNVKTQKVLAKTFNSMRFKIYHLPQTTTEPTETEPKDTTPKVNEPDVPKADVTVPDARVPLASENFPQKRKCCTYDNEEPPNKKPQSDPDIWSDSLNLKMSDRSLVEEGLELNDKIMDAVSQLLKNQFPHLKGLQSTLRINTPEHCDLLDFTATVYRLFIKSLDTTG